MNVIDLLYEIRDSLWPCRGRFVLAAVGIAIGVACAFALAITDSSLAAFLGSSSASAGLSLAELARLNSDMAICRPALIVATLVLLLVGGFNLLGVMLSSVLERREEIEMRRITGACSSDIIRAVLLASVAVCLGAGVVGAVLGSFASFVLMGLMTVDPSVTGFVPILDGGFLVAAACVCVLIGITAGLYPAYRATNPGRAPLS
jgi:ABC-type antimicrobial peptide transport system permease subunit